MIYCISKIILKMILCFTILSMINEFRDVQSAGNSPCSASTSRSNQSICGNISFYDCINNFTMRTINLFYKKCHVTLLLYITFIKKDDLVNGTTMVQEINNYSYMIFLSYTQTGNIWNYIRPFMDVKDIQVMIGDASGVALKYNPEINVEQSLKSTVSNDRKQAYTYCNTVLKNISEHREAFKSYVYAFESKPTESNYPLTLTFGPILLLMRRDEVSNFLDMNDEFKLYRIVDLIQGGVLDIFRGLIQILYKSNLKNSDSSININEDALKLVFLRAFNTAKIVYTYRNKPLENNNPLQSMMSFISRRPSLLKHKKYKHIEQENEDIGTAIIPGDYKTCMNDMNLYWCSESNYANTIFNGRLFNENKIQPSILQFYSAIDTWPSPIKCTSETNNLEVLLMELNGWSEILYYFVTKETYTKHYKRYTSSELGLYERIFNAYEKTVTSLGKIQKIN